MTQDEARAAVHQAITDNGYILLSENTAADGKVLIRVKTTTGVNVASVTIMPDGQCLPGNYTEMHR
jgi:hypothetical protein